MSRLNRCESRSYKIMAGMIPNYWRYSRWYVRCYLVLDAIVCFPYRFFYFISYYIYLAFFLLYLKLKMLWEKIKKFFGIKKNKYN